MKLFEPLATAKTSATTSASSAAKFPGAPLQGPFQVRVVNDGTTLAYIKWGDSTVAATTSDLPIPPNGLPCGFTINNPGRGSQEYYSIIMASGTANVTVTTGYGI